MTNVVNIIIWSALVINVGGVRPCVVGMVCISKRLKEEMAWLTNKRLRVISNVMLNSYTTSWTKE